MKVQASVWETIKDFLRNFFGVAGRMSAQALLSWFLYIPFTFFFYISPENWGHNESLLAMHEVAKLIVISISVFLVAKLVDEIEPGGLGLKRDKWAFFDFSIGFLIAFFVIGLNFLIFLGLGYIKITGFAWESQSTSSVFLYTLGTFVIFAFVGWSEELLSRGFHFKIIEKGFNRFFGAFLSSLIFSYLHRNNPEMTLNGLVFIFLFGLVFAYAYYKTGQLWLAIGLHAGWDFFVAVGFFGVPIVGLKIFHLVDYISKDLSRGEISFAYAMQYFALFVCVSLIRKYLTNRGNTINSAVGGESLGNNMK